MVTWDRQEGRRRTFAMADCGFGPGGSRFTEVVDGERRFEVLEVTLLFRAGTITAPIRDEDLARLLDVEPGARVELSRVRDTVLAAARG